MHDTLYFTDHHFQVRDMVRDFAQRVVKPSAHRYDVESTFPWDNVRRMADLGLFGIPWPEELGGSGMDYLSYILVIRAREGRCESRQHREAPHPARHLAHRGPRPPGANTTLVS